MIAIAAATALAGTAALVAVRDAEPSAPRFVATADDSEPAAMPADPLAPELLRCRSVPAGVDDPACREAWEANRRRFIGESPSDWTPRTPGGTEGR